MFYSSAFLSVILAFFLFLNAHGEKITVVQGGGGVPFSNTERTDLATETILAQNYARLTLEVFDRFGCGECDRMAEEIMPVFKARYVGNEEVKFSVFITPDPADEGQREAARGLICAGTQGLYWEMYEALHRVTEPLSRREVDLTAQGIGAEIVPFRDCITAEETQEKLQKDMDYAQQKKVARWPTVFVNEYGLSAYQPLENIDRIIRRVTRSADVVTP